MRITFKYLNDSMSYEKVSVNTLIIENIRLYRDTLELFEENEAEESFVFSKNFTPFEFENKGMYISNPLSPDISNKKLMTKVNNYLAHIAGDEHYEVLKKIKSELSELGNVLSKECDFDFEYNGDVDTMSIIKLLEFKVKKSTDTTAELLVRFIMLMRKYLKVEIFVLPNMHLYFEPQELEKMFHTFALNDVKVLCIDYVSNDKALENEQYHIVDKDLCCIDNDRII